MGTKEQDALKTPRILKEKEIVSLFMACGILEHVAKDIVKSCSELKDLTDNISEDFKIVLRESLSILEKEGVPNISISIEASEDKSSVTRKITVALCRICSDTAAIKAKFPEKMGKWFRINQGYKGRIRSEDWLCKGCYGEWYRDNRELLSHPENTKDDQIDESSNDYDKEEDLEKQKNSRRKEFYLKTIINLLYLTVKNLSPKAVTHRKMLIRYITLGEITFNSLPTALNYLRKLKNGILDQEEFECECGIHQYSDLFYFSSWKAIHSHKEILHLNEQERLAKKAEKQKLKEKEHLENKEQVESDKLELEKQKKYEIQLLNAEKEALEKSKLEKQKKLLESRKKEDEEIIESRKKSDSQKLKLREKRESEKLIKKLQREQEIRTIDNNYKAKLDDLQKKKDERFRNLRLQSHQRAADSMNKILFS